MQECDTGAIPKVAVLYAMCVLQLNVRHASHNDFLTTTTSSSPLNAWNIQMSVWTIGKRNVIAVT